jgi:hypothetical protein
VSKKKTTGTQQQHAGMEEEEQLAAHQVVGVLFDLWRTAKELGIAVEELIDAVGAGLTPREAVAIAAEVARRGDLPGGASAFRNAFRLARVMREIEAASLQLDRDDIRGQAASLGIQPPSP